MNTKTWIIFGVVCVALLGGLIALSRSQNPSTDISGVDANSIIDASAANGNIGDHVDGNRDSKVVLIEYGDFQCPGCGSIHPGLKKIVEDYNDKIAFVFRNFPLTSMHPNAVAAATAVEAAGLQNKYWPMHNLVFENQNLWNNLSAAQRTDKFIELATQAGVENIDKFKTDLSAKSIGQKISFDQSLGKSQDVTGTPTLLLNGEKIESDASNGLTDGNDKAFRELLNSKLKENGIEPPVNQ